MAVGDILQKEGTPIVWTDSGGDEVLDLGTANGDAGAVCVGAYHDFGLPPRAREYRMDIDLDGFDSAPAAPGEQVDIYITIASSTTTFTGPESPSDASSGAGDTNRLPNLMGPFPVTIHSTTAGDNLRQSYEFFSSSQYLAPVTHNNTALKLLSTGDAHRITITPLYMAQEQ